MKHSSGRCAPTVCAARPAAAADEQRQQRLVDERQDDLRFGIAEPHVELDHLRAVRASASGRRKESRETDALRRAMPASTGSTISRMMRASQRGVDQRARRERAHAAGVRPAVVVEDALVILRGADRHGARAVADRRRTTLPGRSGTPRSRARSPAAPNSPIAHRRDDGGFGRRAIVGDDDALAGGEAVGLQHDRQAELADANDAQRLVGATRTCESARSARRDAP